MAREGESVPERMLCPLGCRPWAGMVRLRETTLEEMGSQETPYQEEDEEELEKGLVEGFQEPRRLEGSEWMDALKLRSQEVSLSWSWS